MGIHATKFIGACCTLALCFCTEHPLCVSWLLWVKLRGKRRTSLFSLKTSPSKMSDPKILFVGAGAIGAAVAAWVAEHYAEVYIQDIGEIQIALEANGITTYQTDAPSTSRRTTPIRTLKHLADTRQIDIVVLAVKNYSLDAAAQQVHAQFGDRPIIVSMANGAYNQSVLPKLFSKVIYCVVGFNARRDAPVVVGFKAKGPLLLGTPDNSLQAELHQVQAVLARGCPTQIVDRLQDAVHTKIVVNLVNALDALVGRGSGSLSGPDAYQKLLLHTWWEGARIMRASGYHEYRIRGFPSFMTLRFAMFLPSWVVRPLLSRKLRNVVMTSMTQDVLLRGAYQTELDSLTGYVLGLAKRAGISAPYNEAIYRLGQKHFHPGFVPLHCEDVLAAVSQAGS